MTALSKFHLLVHKVLQMPICNKFTESRNLCVHFDPLNSCIVSSNYHHGCSNLSEGCWWKMYVDEKHLCWWKPFRIFCQSVFINLLMITNFRFKAFNSGIDTLVILRMVRSWMTSQNKCNLFRFSIFLNYRSTCDLGFNTIKMIAWKRGICRYINWMLILNQKMSKSPM